MISPRVFSALAIAVTVELTPLYHAPWIDAVRASRVGALVFGQGVLWSDLACYAVGACLAGVIDWWWSRAFFATVGRIVYDVWNHQELRTLSGGCDDYLS